MPSISRCFHADDSRVMANTEARYVVVLRKLFKQYAATVREIDSRGSSCRQAAPRFRYCPPIMHRENCLIFIQKSRTYAVCEVAQAVLRNHDTIERATQTVTEKSSAHVYHLANLILLPAFNL